MSNLAAMVVARNAARRHNRDRGLDGRPYVAYTSQQSHYSIVKNANIIGVGRRNVRLIPVDSRGRLSVSQLRRRLAEDLRQNRVPFFINATAGTTSLGVFDPIADIAAVAREHGVWLHVDGAFGLWAAASPERAPLAGGVAEADSWATDAHKWLNVPYDSGLAFVRQPGILPRAMSVTAAYLPTADEREPSFYTPELSRRARGVEVWAALRSLGRSGVAELVERCCRHARRFAQGLSEAGHEILNDVVLNQVLVSFGDADTTHRVVDAIQRDGTSWCGTTVWHGHTAMRISVSSWATTDDDVERSLAAMVRLAKGVQETAR
jgi:glutamate/tyrosine decarboxylase-like PLP-dependent enzyme